MLYHKKTQQGKIRPCRGWLSRTRPACGAAGRREKAVIIQYTNFARKMKPVFFAFDILFLEESS